MGSEVPWLPSRFCLHFITVSSRRSRCSTVAKNGHLRRDAMRLRSARQRSGKWRIDVVSQRPRLPVFAPLSQKHQQQQQSVHPLISCHNFLYLTAFKWSYQPRFQFNHTSANCPQTDIHFAKNVRSRLAEQLGEIQPREELLLLLNRPSFCSPLSSLSN